MKISDTGIQLIEQFEGLKLISYLCPAGVWTIGIGTTKIKGIPVKRGQRCTKEQAYQYFRCHMEIEIYPVFDSIKVELNQNQFDALCSLIYNIGVGAFKSSTILKKLNQNDFDGAAKEFSRWVKVNGKKVNGLIKRRIHEQELFSKPCL